jgi:acyl-[acyl-carrier-protein]-phospholipid O-acyltransferase/long-chain-fatty-acid--[acyl-carrier-protein] ligase
MIPGEVLVVDKLPVLGSGKLDHVGVARLVRERAAGPAPVAAA